MDNNERNQGLRLLVILSLYALVLVGTVTVTLSGEWCPPQSLQPPCESTPQQRPSTVGLSFPLAQVVLSNLPQPMPNQLRAGQCDPDRAEEEIEGGCWVRTKTKPSPDCPAGKQWEYRGACYVPAMQPAPRRPPVASP